VGLKGGSLGRARLAQLGDGHAMAVRWPVGPPAGDKRLAITSSALGFAFALISWFEISSDSRSWIIRANHSDWYRIGCAATAALIAFAVAKAARRRWSEAWRWSIWTLGWWVLWLLPALFVAAVVALGFGI